MAHTTITAQPGVWTQLTSGDVTALRAENKSSWPIELQATADGTAPSGIAGSVTLASRALLLPDVTLAQLFPGIAGAARLWAWTDCYAVQISVSHE